MVYTATEYWRTGDLDVAWMTRPCLNVAIREARATLRAGALGVRILDFLEWLYHLIHCDHTSCYCSPFRTYYKMLVLLLRYVLAFQHKIQGDSKTWTHFVSFYGFMEPRHTSDSWLRYSKFSARSTGWLAWATLKTFLNSSHVLLWYTWSNGAFAFTQTAYLFKLVIPTTNALPRWRLNIETKTKRTLYSSRRLGFN